MTDLLQCSKHKINCSFILYLHSLCLPNVGRVIVPPYLSQRDVMIGLLYIAVKLSFLYLQNKPDKLPNSGINIRLNLLSIFHLGCNCSHWQGLFNLMKFYTQRFLTLNRTPHTLLMKSPTLYAQTISKTRITTPPSFAVQYLVSTNAIQMYQLFNLC